MQNLRVRLLGDLVVEGSDPAALGRRQVRTLLKILALRHDRPVTTDTIIECLWGEQPPARPTDQVSVLASRLRKAVGAERVQHSDGGYTLLVDWLDLDALRDYADQAEQRLTQAAVAAARIAAATGLSLVRGPLLGDEADPWWAQTERTVAEIQVTRLQHVSVKADLAVGDWAGAVQRSNELLAADPYDEVVLRSLMEALARSGRPASALAAYAETRERLAEDLGASPTPETEELHTALLVGAVPDAPIPIARHRDAPADLPGRAEPLRRLDELLERSRAGHGALVLVEGEGGMGKSRLLEVWGGRLAETGLALVTVACDELGQGLPYQPLLDVVGELIHTASNGETDEVLGSDDPVLGPLLGRTAGSGGSAQLAALTDPGAGQALLFGALNGVLRRAARRQPLVVIIDDVHLADPATARWLTQSPRRLSDAPILIVGARRPEEGSPTPGAVTITLEPLDLQSAAAIVGEERALALHARSAGNALFLVELANADPSSELPASIRAAVADRCERAGDAAPTLRAASVIGSEVDLQLLAAVTGTSPSLLLDHLEEGLRRRFLVEDGAGFTFAHALVREALAATVGAARTAFIHREAARALGARPDPDLLAVARHARLGGEVREAAAMLMAAAQVALDRFDHEEALRLLSEAVTLHDSAAARIERARVFSMLARHLEADDDIDAARTLGAGPEALEAAAWSAHLERRFDDALALADRGAREAITEDLRTSCLALGGWVSLVSGDLTGAETRLEGALGSAPETSGRMAESWMAWLRMNQCRPNESLRLVNNQYGRGLATYRFPNAYALMAATMSLAMLGRVNEALATLDELDAVVARLGAVRWIPRTLNLRGWLARNMGEPGLGDEFNDAAMDAAGGPAMGEPRANALLDLVSGRLLSGDLSAAASRLADAERLAEGDHAFRWRHQLRARLLRSRLDLAAGEPEGALGAAATLAVDAATLGAPRYEVQAQLVEGVARHRAGLEAEPLVLEQLLGRLGEVAGLESWWITAEVSEEFGVTKWEDLARARVASLLKQAGPYRKIPLRRAAALRLD